MKTETAHYFAIVTFFTFIIFLVPMSSLATNQISEFDSTASNINSDADHSALAHFYENQAKEIQAKIDEQVETLSHKPRSSYFGKHGKDVRKHVKYKIDQFKKAAEENLQKAAYHKKMAKEQSSRPTYAKSSKTKG